MCCRDESDQEKNVWFGCCSAVFFFTVISVLAFPNGPFTRPHPAVSWKICGNILHIYWLILLHAVL